MLFLLDFNGMWPKWLGMLPAGPVPHRTGMLLSQKRTGARFDIYCSNAIDPGAWIETVCFPWITMR